MTWCIKKTEERERVGKKERGERKSEKETLQMTRSIKKQEKEEEQEGKEVENEEVRRKKTLQLS